LIDVPQEYQLAFYFVMRDTLVAENLEQAVKIAYQGERPWKVVTLQGELIDANGTMSGGGGKTRSGLMNLHGSARAASASGGVSEKEVAKKEKKLKALTQQYEDTEKTVQSLKEDVSSLEAELPRLSKQIKRMQMDIDSFKNRLHDLDSQLASLRDKSAISKKEEKEMKVRNALKRFDVDVLI
jgi:structural maintenance of chromosome 4